MSTTTVLYITYDGITDHIGQSQVAPYLLGLAAMGHKITLLSAEKPGNNEIIAKYKSIFSENNVEWHYVQYHKSPPVVSTVWDIYKMYQKAGDLIRKDNIKILHCRSYVASLIGLYYKKKRNIKFIFDMRDFWADAGKETKRFDIENNRMHYAVYTFFKKKEKQFLEHADYIISLTAAGKKIIENWEANGMQIMAPIAVIPCCADYNFFDRKILDEQKLLSFRSKLGLNKNDFVMNYLGSLGPAYLTNELLDLFKILLEIKPGAKFLVVANNDHQLVIEAAKKKEIDPGKLIIVKGQKVDIPYYIALSDLSVFFIMPSFAKQACSPTKLAELFAMNVPVISNTKVGDLDDLLNLEQNNSMVIKEFTNNEYKAVLEKVLLRIQDHGNKQIRSNSRELLSLDAGISLYDKVYNELA